ncbi:hypothetical protein D3C83_272830 [compost metagenome]
MIASLGEEAASATACKLNAAAVNANTKILFNIELVLSFFEASFVSKESKQRKKAKTFTTVRT